MRTNFADARQQWLADRAQHAERGVILNDVVSYLPDDFRRNVGLALDALPSAGVLQSAPNAGIPAILTTFIDPEVIRVRFSPNKAAKIYGERKAGDWTKDTEMFNVLEQTGEVSSYGDRNNNGRVGINQNFPQRQQYLFQTIKDVGDRELARAGLTQISYVSEIDMAAAVVMGKFENFSYFFGVQGLQNYGLINDPDLSAPLTPGAKASPAVGVTWFTNLGAPNATANEVYNDIVSLFHELVTQCAGLIDKDASMKLVLSPDSAVALTFTNSFNVNVEDLLKKNFKNLTVETAVQFGAKTASNPQGNAAGNLVQLIAETVDGTKTGFCSFSEKMRAHPIVRALSSFQQKLTGGTWGAVIRLPYAVAQMVGV